MIQCNDLLSLLKKPNKVADFIDSLNNEVGDLVSCMGNKDGNGNTILHSIINNAANPKFNNAKTSEALYVYFSYLNSKTISPSDLQNLLTIKNYSDQSPTEALLAKSSKFNDKNFINVFCEASVLRSLNPEITNLFDSSMVQVFRYDRDSILGCFEKYAPLEKSLHASSVVYIRSLYKDEESKMSIKLSDLADKAKRGGWLVQEDNLYYNTIPYLLFSYGLEYEKSRDLFSNITKNEFAISEELNLMVHNNTLVYKNLHSERNMLIITGAYDKNDLMLGLDYTFHDKGFNICSINSNRYDKFDRHSFENFDSVGEAETIKIKGYIQVCGMGNFDIAIIHAHNHMQIHM